jgi:acyl carrier protein
MTNASASEQFGTFRCPIKQGQLDLLLAGRDPYDDPTIWERCFRAHGVTLDTVIRIRRILNDILEVDLSLMRARESLFTKELSFLWDLDSLADLKIMHALEVEFNIAISDAEAEAMKSLRDIVLAVHAKITARPSVPLQTATAQS